MLLSKAIKIVKRKLLEKSEISRACNYQSVTWNINYHWRDTNLIVGNKLEMGSFQIIYLILDIKGV